jgi:hypothetical protein
MTTVEFFDLVFDHLTEDGVLVINIGRSPLDRTLVNDLGTTIQQVFPTVFVMDLPGSFNTLLFATKSPGSWQNFYHNYSTLEGSGANSLLLEAMALTINYRQEPPVESRVYTDDRAPIELLTNKMVLDFILAGGTEELQ